MFTDKKFLVARIQALSTHKAHLTDHKNELEYEIQDITKDLNNIQSELDELVKLQSEITD